jgi:hypothetical protein
MATMARDVWPVSVVEVRIYAPLGTPTLGGCRRRLLLSFATVIPRKSTAAFKVALSTLRLLAQSGSGSPPFVQRRDGSAANFLRLWIAR